ncbi:MAG: DNA polymerase III subunit alpha [Deltaproteobacteria bacterium]|nr:DNA polymerase III subunit alpha [Deltaproteobacteria bacterium]
MSFVHLHVHTQYSIADATLRIADAVRFAAEQKMPALAITDHGNLHGAIDFANACKDAGIKPIFGCCMAIANRPIGEHVRRVHNLTLLAATEQGYLNLIHLISMANLKVPEGVRPRLDPATLREHAAGIIGLSGDLSGELANALLRGESDEAWRAAERYKSWFEPGNFYIEVQRSGLQEHAVVAPQLVDLGRQLGIPCVATNDVHYLRPSDARAHEVLMCIGLGTQARPENQRLPTEQLDLASPEEMRRRFADMDQLCDVTLEIAERCQAFKISHDPMLPRFPVAEGKSEFDTFYEMSRAGLERRFAEFERIGKLVDRDAYWQRLEFEIATIKKMDFPGYFLIVQDFINWAKEHGIPVGPGRGSGAGSLVAYALRITDLDPIPYKLLFERFLNPERVSMPDFDVDFCEDRRTEVIRYVSERYGAERVGQIATFGTLKAKGAVRDVGRVLAVPLPEVDGIAKIIDTALEGVKDDKHKTVEDAMQRDPRLLQAMEQSDQIRQLLETAQLLEGSMRGTGMHAAGVVIGRGPLWTHVPVGRGQNGENVTQFDKDDVEKAGLVKFDFLGLSNLTMIAHCVELIRLGQKPGEKPFDIATVPLDDHKAFEVISRGDTAGIFQCESPGFTRMMVAMKPTVFEDLVASGALYRPGPLGMGMDKVYIDRKHGRQETVFDHPALATVLGETYGVIVYQEQVMHVAQILGGFSLGQADLLRRAMGKKKPAEMAKWGEDFKKGCDARGDVDSEVADKIFALMAKFAEYGFNKSHSAAYGLITYHTAWLKANYPVEFYAALLTRDKDDTDRIVGYLQQARQGGIQVLPPDVNESQLSFSVSQGRVRFGLGAIKGLGEGAIDVLMEARKSGPFESLFDLLRRVDTRKVNKKSLEVLIKAGACDGLGADRDVLWSNLGLAVELAQDSAKRGKTPSLFGEEELHPDKYQPATEQWTQRQILANEKEVLGFYVSGHPLDRYAKDLHRLQVRNLVQLKDWEYFQANAPPPRGPQDPNAPPRPRRMTAHAAVVVVAHKERPLNDGRRMGITMLEDRSGQAEALSFDGLDQFGELLKGDQPLLLTLQVGEDRKEANKVSLRIEKAALLDEVMKDEVERLTVRLAADQCNPVKLKALCDAMAACKGPARLRLLVHVEGQGDVVIDASERFLVQPGDELVGAVERILGRGALVYG